MGATERHAHWVLRELTQRGVSVRALVRNQQRADVARQNGAAEVAIGDLTEPATRSDAVAGMDGVFHIGPAHSAREAEMGVAMTRMMAHYDKHGLPGGNPLVLRSILGREPRSLTDYFRELASR